MSKVFNRKFIFLAMLIFPIGILASLYLLGLIFWPAEPPPLPSPDGYDKLIEASERIEGYVLVAEERDQAELAEFIHSNSEALTLKREALKEEAQVPVRYDPNYFDPISGNLLKVRLLGSLLSMEGKLAEQRGDWKHALECYLDN